MKLVQCFYACAWILVLQVGCLDILMHLYSEGVRNCCLGIDNRRHYFRMNLMRINVEVKLW